jgi:hypothetical protein
MKECADIRGSLPHLLPHYIGGESLYSDFLYNNPESSSPTTTIRKGVNSTVPPSFSGLEWYGVADVLSWPPHICGEKMQRDLINMSRLHEDLQAHKEELPTLSSPAIDGTLVDGFEVYEGDSPSSLQRWLPASVCPEACTAFL